MVSDFVVEYLRIHNKKDTSATVNASDVGCAVTVNDSDSDGDIEYIKTEMASPRTKKFMKMSTKIVQLESQIASLTSKTKSKLVNQTPKNGNSMQIAPNQTCSSMNSIDLQSSISIEPQSSTSYGSTSSASALSSMVDFDVSIDDDTINQMVADWDPQGQLPEIAAEVMDFIKQQQ